jgi:ubiquinone/menaquinone biosynthesis C-methylase UbiE
MTERTSHPATDHKHFIPCLGQAWRTPLYDLVHKLTGMGKLHVEVIRAADTTAGQRVLDIGCGTGNLLIALGKRRPGATLIGLDPDRAPLRRASRKARRAGLTLQADHGYAEQLPYPDQSVDRVLSTLMFHHLSAQAKEATLTEVRRVLKPGGMLVLADMEGDHHHSDHDHGDHDHGDHDHSHHDHSRHGPHRFWRRVPKNMAALAKDNGNLTERIAAAGLTPQPWPPYHSRFGEIAIIRATR